MASLKFKAVITTGTVATVAFFGGKYYERHNLPHRINLPYKPALPIFGTVSAEENNFKTKSFIETILPTIQAASLIPSDTPVATPNSNRISQIMKYGFPSLDNVISYNDFVISYDKRNRVAHWVFEHLTPESVKKNDQVDRSKCNFVEDKSIHPYFRSYNSDYKSSGYDRGHLAAAGNHKSCQKHVEETFYLSNMAPQVGKGFNRDSWNRLEKYVRKLTRTYPNVYCCTGPLYLPQRDQNGKMYVKYEVIGASHVAVPTHFYKIVVGETKDGKLEMESYVMQNAPIDDSIPIKQFQVAPDVIERAAGLLFFDNVARNRIHTINGKKV